MKKLIALVFLLLLPDLVAAQSQDSAADAIDTPASQEMLEFLAEWGSIDDETWELLEHHALEDVSASAEVTN